MDLHGIIMDAFARDLPSIFSAAELQATAQVEGLAAVALTEAMLLTRAGAPPGLSLSSWHLALLPHERLLGIGKRERPEIYALGYDKEGTMRFCLWYDWPTNREEVLGFLHDRVPIIRPSASWAFVLGVAAADGQTGEDLVGFLLDGEGFPDPVIEACLAAIDHGGPRGRQVVDLVLRYNCGPAVVGAWDLGLAVGRALRLVRNQTKGEGTGRLQAAFRLVEKTFARMSFGGDDAVAEEVAALLKAIRLDLEDIVDPQMDPTPPSWRAGQVSTSLTAAVLNLVILRGHLERWEGSSEEDQS